MTPLQGAALGAMSFMLSFAMLVSLLAMKAREGNPWLMPAIAVNSLALALNAAVVLWNLGRLG